MMMPDSSPVILEHQLASIGERLRYLDSLRHAHRLQAAELRRFRAVLGAASSLQEQGACDACMHAERAITDTHTLALLPPPPVSQVWLCLPLCPLQA